MTLFFVSIYVCGLLGMAGVTVGQIIEISKAIEQVAGKL